MPEKISNPEIMLFTHTLLEWFKKNGRNYPWRKENDPYRILIAEVMLQRTRADQVVPVFLKFVEEFQDAKSLSVAGREEIARFFQKLGLLWRIERTMDLAKNLVSYHNGAIPPNYALLKGLPGVGTYVADAVTVFAFNGRKTVVDANVVRLVSRYFGLKVRGEVRRNRQFIEFCQKLSEALPADDIKPLNWALIDFPAAICRPAPLCPSCPLKASCRFYNEEH